jgi:hypothetical protein
MHLDDFLKTYVQGYLLADLRSMAQFRLRARQRMGALGYPLVMTTAAGIELLGTLSCSSPVLGNNGAQHFCFFWKEWLYNSDQERQRLGDTVYQLARHGIAHYFVARPRITVTRLQNAKNHHLRIDPKTADTLIIDAPTLVRDFRAGYTRWKAKLDADPSFRRRCEARFQQLTALTANQSANQAETLRKTTRASMPLPSPRVTRNTHINVNSPTANPSVFTVVNASTKSMKP